MYEVVEVSLTERLLPGLPVLLVCLVGIVLAIVFWRRHPGVGGLMISGICLILLRPFLGFCLLPLVAGVSPGSGDFEETVMIQKSVSFVFNGVYAVGVLLILAAAFAGRGASCAAEERVGIDRPQNQKRQDCSQRDVTASDQE